MYVPVPKVRTVPLRAASSERQCQVEATFQECWMRISKAVLHSLSREHVAIVGDDTIAVSHETKGFFGKLVGVWGVGLNF